MLLGEFPTNNCDFKELWVDFPQHAESNVVFWQRQLSSQTFPPIRVVQIAQMSRVRGVTKFAISSEKVRRKTCFAGAMRALPRDPWERFGHDPHIDWLGLRDKEL